jgi:Flp pilus assembly protein TadD
MTINLTQKMICRSRLAVAVGLICAALAVSAEDSFTMKVHPKETPGSWEIEHGQYERAVTLLEIAAARSMRSGRDEGPIQTNLCVAYTKLGDYDTATRYCDRAVEVSFQFGVAYNNRGVLQALKNNFAAAAADFDAAINRRESAEVAKLNKERLGEHVSQDNGDSPRSASTEPAV